MSRFWFRRGCRPGVLFGVLLRHFLNGNSINRRCVVQPCKITWFKSIMLPFLLRGMKIRGLSVGCCVFTVLCGRMLSEQVLHIIYLIHMKDLHAQKHPTLHIFRQVSINGKQRSSTEVYEIFFNKLWLGTRTNATYLSLNTWWPNLFCVQPGFFFKMQSSSYFMR